MSRSRRSHSPVPDSRGRRVEVDSACVEEDYTDGDSVLMGAYPFSDVDIYSESRIPRLQGSSQFSNVYSKTDTEGYFARPQAQTMGMPECMAGLSLRSSPESYADNIVSAAGSSYNKQKTISPELPSTRESSQIHSIDEAYCSVTSSYNSHSTTSEPCSSNVQGELQRKHQTELKELFTQDEDGDTQFHIAIIQGVTVVTSYFLKLSPPVHLLNIQNLLEQTALHLAVITGQASIVRHLVICQAPLETRDHMGNTALHLACRHGNIDAVQALCSPVTHTELTDTLGPLHSTPSFTPTNLSHLRDYKGDTCIHIAGAQGHTHILAYLLQPILMTNVNVKDGCSGRTVLHHAVEWGSTDLVTFLLHRCRADVNARTFSGITPLMLAHGRKRTLVESLLLQAGADPNQIGLDDEDDSEEEVEDLGACSLPSLHRVQAVF